MKTTLETSEDEIYTRNECLSFFPPMLSKFLFLALAVSPAFSVRGDDEAAFQSMLQALETRGAEPGARSALGAVDREFRSAELLEAVGPEDETCGIEDPDGRVSCRGP